VTTAEIASTLRAGAEWNHHVELAGAAQYPELSLPIDPYVLGVWLGDGTSSCAEVTVGHADEQTLDEIRAAGYQVWKSGGKIGLSDRRALSSARGRVRDSAGRYRADGSLSELVASYAPVVG
jgi:hypothetical protein